MGILPQMAFHYPILHRESGWYVRAVEAYHLSDDPYAWYRIGQSFEEGWLEAPNMEIAMQWYKKAAAAHHHLAIVRSNIRQ